MSSGLLVVLHLLALQAGRSGSLSVFRGHSRYDSWLMRRVAQQIQTEAPASVAPAPALSRAIDIPSVSACTSHVTLRGLPRSVVAAQALHLPTHCASNASKRSHGPRPRAPPLRPSSASRFSSPHSKSPRTQPTQTLGSTSPLPRRRLHIRLTISATWRLSKPAIVLGVRVGVRAVCAGCGGGDRCGRNWVRRGRMERACRPGLDSERWRLGSFDTAGAVSTPDIPSPAASRLRQTLLDATPTVHLDPHPRPRTHHPHAASVSAAALRPPPSALPRRSLPLPHPLSRHLRLPVHIRLIHTHPHPHRPPPPLPIFTLPVHTTPSAPSASPSASA
ncbi:hypothetical protein B0H11DRAFT_819119 [Mycena galericulata]|nr:hypothetical protein B0H11DRAFT_819119 [Mycena galericulata]